MLLILLALLVSAHAKEFDICERVGVLNARYLDEDPQRIVIYDANYNLQPSTSIYKVNGHPKQESYQQVGVETLEVGSLLSYKVGKAGAKRQNQIKAIWILPPGHCQSSD